MTQNNPMQSSCDVVIVGGGLVGLTLANALRGARLSVAVVDAQPAPQAVAKKAPSRQGYCLQSGYSARVSAMNLASEALLSRLGAWPDSRSPYTGMRVWDSRGTASIDFDTTLTGTDHLGTIVENPQLVVALFQQAQGLDTLSLHYDQSIETVDTVEEGYQVTLSRGETLRCRLLVGADGGVSRVRALLNMKTLEWNYGQGALVTTVETQQPHQNIARQCFTPSGPLALLPLPTSNLCSVVWSTDNLDALKECDDQAFCHLLATATEHVLGDVTAVDRRVDFNLRQRHALRYIKPGLALIGDAAHTLHPLAGQGANLGLADAAALAALLQQCRYQGLSPGDMTLLRQFERQRQPANLVMTAAMEGFKRVFDTDDPIVNWLRNISLGIVDHQRPVKAALAKLATGL